MALFGGGGFHPFKDIRERVGEIEHNHEERAAERKLRRSERRKRRASRRADRRLNREERAAFRRYKHQARVAHRKGKFDKKYRGFDPQEQEDVQKLQPYHDAMLQDLDNKGIEVENPDDTTEVAAKYAQTNEDIINPYEDDDYNDYIADESDFESTTEYADRKGRANVAIKAGLGALTGGINSYLQSLEDKEASGKQLTANEKAMLDAKDEASKSATKSSIGDIVMNYWWVILLILALFIIFKKK